MLYFFVWVWWNCFFFNVLENIHLLLCFCFVFVFLKYVVVVFIIIIYYSILNLKYIKSLFKFISLIFRLIIYIYLINVCLQSCQNDLKILYPKIKNEIYKFFLNYNKYFKKLLNLGFSRITTYLIKSKFSVSSAKIL